MLTGFLQIGGAVPSSPAELIRHASALTQGVLILLALLSLISWAVMFGAWREIARTLKAGRALLREIEKMTRLEQVSTLARAIRGRFLYSGGIASLDDLRALCELRLVNLAGVISGKALYEKRFTVAEGQAALDAL